MNARTLHRINLALLAALYAASAVTYLRLPVHTPIHLGLGGNPDLWTRTSVIPWLLPPVIATGVFRLLRLATGASDRHPEQWNIPEKERFLSLSPEARAPIVARLNAFLALVGVLVTALLGTIQLEMFLTATAPDGTAARWLIPAAVLVMLMVTGVATALMSNRVGREIREAHRLRA
ncbi:hypothetical protein [Longimicrobium sp.]|jgi:uncharacterized membrane protein|uniref:hypothetical protein n=1 Tax=Longimicrobium sp. TaxID=2029185 RepID=UPI002ED96176